MQRWERMSFDMCVECTRPEEALVTRYECKGMCAQPSARPAHNEKAAAEQMKARVLRRWHVPGRLVPRPRKDFEHACCLLVLVFSVRSRIGFEAQHPWIDDTDEACIHVRVPCS